MKDRIAKTLTLDAAVIALFLAYVFSFSVFNILSADTWLTLRTGRWIVENLAVPAGNFFSFTAPDRPWVEHKWLFDVGSYAVFRIGGTQALVLVKAVVVCLAVLFLVLRSRLRAQSPRPDRAVPLREEGACRREKILGESRVGRGLGRSCPALPAARHGGAVSRSMPGSSRSNA